MPLMSATIGWFGKFLAQRANGVQAFGEDQRRAGLQPVHPGTNGGVSHAQRFGGAGDVA